MYNKILRGRVGHQEEGEAVAKDVSFAMSKNKMFTGGALIIGGGGGGGGGGAVG